MEKADDEFNVQKDEDEEMDNVIEGKDIEQDDIVEKLLKNFLIETNSPFLDDINLVLMMRALPSKIYTHNLDQMTLFNFAIV